MSTVSKNAVLVLDRLVDGLDVGDSKKFDNGGPFMAAHVEALQRTGAGVLYSVAHYFEQNGDLVPDPDVVFVRTTDGWSPISFQNALAYRVAVQFQDDGTIEIDEREQRDLVAFCNQWMRNIQEQQGLSLRES